jgi:hypothetical protein
MSRRLPRPFYNPVTFGAAAVAAVCFGLIIFLVILELTAEQQKPYMGVIAFVILPTFLIIALAVAVYGILREQRLIRKGLVAERQFPTIDLNDPRHRRAFVFITAGSVVFLLFSAFGSYKAYEHTDSDAFCGETCHTVMEPEYTAYQFSPHAKVGCAKCHIGAGADWFVKSKISGSYQVYSTMFNKYPRPIQTPIKDLRPAQETCEQCHWPQHFFSEKLEQYAYFGRDEKNPRWDLDLILKVGGGIEEAGPTSGIHWHMNIANEVTYIARDDKRQDIPWVEARSKDGSVRVYRNADDPMTEEEMTAGERRRMDCIDCHNRPTHIYHPPQRSVNHLMSVGWIDPALPFAKAVAVDALETEFTSKEAAFDSIGIIVRSYYAESFPDISVGKKASIDRMVDELRKVHARTYFPYMKMNWKAVTDNVGHMYYPGCFRCHDGKHVSDDGKVLSRDCNTCHTILTERSMTGKVRSSPDGLDFVHPVDIGDAWKEMNCSECHSGR